MNISDISLENKHRPPGNVHSTHISNNTYPLFHFVKIYFVRLVYRKRSPLKKLGPSPSAFIHLAILQRCLAHPEEQGHSLQRTNLMN